MACVDTQWVGLFGWWSALAHRLCSEGLPCVTLPPKEQERGLKPICTVLLLNVCICTGAGTDKGVPFTVRIV
jgi:hypothetical protein